MERFKRLLPEIARITPLAGDEAMNVWEAYDESDSIIAYAFTAIVPEVVPDIPDIEEMDKQKGRWAKVGCEVLNASDVNAFIKSRNLRSPL